MPKWARTTALLGSDGQLLAFNNDAIQLRPGPALNKLKLQCRPDPEVDFTTLEQAVGSKIPRSPQETTGTNPSIFWLAPNEWLMISTDMEIQILHTKLVNIVTSQTHAISDLTNSLEVIELSGEKSTDLLSESCGFDLDTTSFQSGQYAVTRLYQLSAIIHRIGEEACFRIYVDRSVALYFWHWLVNGASLVNDKDRRQMANNQKIYKER